MSPLRNANAQAGRRAARWSEIYAAGCFGAAVALLPFIDRLSAVLLILGTFLFWTVTRYARRYMDGDPGQARFALWLCATASCVLVLVLAQNLLVFAAAWCATSLSLHRLLQFYRHRSGALLAARKKFLISRLGDVSLAAALVLVWKQFGTFDFWRIFRLANNLRAAEHIPAAAAWACVLVAFAAMLKSGQFPFHSWLPDTMETPTPVSALMHAGIINAGGILVIRLSPLISLSHEAMAMLALVGGFTALFASVVMLAQASIKRALAFSTVAQMGFMMLECGLGAFHLALVHIVAHSVYKAYAFLSSGRAASSLNQRRRPPSPLAMLLGLSAAVAICAAGAAILPATAFGQPALIGIFALALAQMLWSLAAAQPVFARMLAGLVAAAGLTALYGGLEWIGARVVAPVHPAAQWPAIAVLAAFAIVALAESQIARLENASWFRSLWVHARNGFYVNALANRTAMAIWPVRN